MADVLLSRWARTCFDRMTEWGDADRAVKSFLVSSEHFDVVVAQLSIAAAIAALPRLPASESGRFRRWAGGRDE